MSESQEREAKRLVEILIELGYIEEIYSADPMRVTKYFEMKFTTKKRWIQALAEAIKIYKAEELKTLMKLG